MASFPNNRSDLFWSHVCVDHEILNQIRAWLTAVGYSTWCDQFSLGDHISPAITEGINNAGICCILFSPDYQQKLRECPHGFLKQEFDLITSKPNYIVVMVGNVDKSSLPDEIRKRKYETFDEIIRFGIYRFIASVDKILSKIR
jgi:hypothetical protein